LLSHPDISDAAVIGIAAGGANANAGEQGSELPRAYIVRKPGSHIGETEVQTYMKERLAGYKQLAGGVKFVDAIPKNASGKILKKDLKATARLETSAKL